MCRCHLKRDHFTLFHKENNLPIIIFQGHLSLVPKGRKQRAHQKTPKFSWGLDDVCVCVLCTIRVGQLLHLDCLAYCMMTAVFQQLAHYSRMNPTRFVLSGLYLLLVSPPYLYIFPFSFQPPCRRASRNKNPWFFASFRRSS